MFIMLEQEEGKKKEREEKEKYLMMRFLMFNGAKRLKFRVCAEHIKNISRYRSTPRSLEIPSLALVNA